ncbi:MAG: divergent polysaccharide deacetylase family protein [Rhodobacter sp.]|nr:divergent polysaccharide deacetylase family protein [Rhodobacter sp.]
MWRGFLSGIFWGVLLAVIGVGVASQFTGPVDLTAAAPEAAAVDVPVGSEFRQERPDTRPVLPQNEGRPASTQPPQVPVAEPGVETLPTTDTEPAAEPQPGSVEEALAPVPAAGEAPEVNVESDEAVLPAPGAVQPPEPAADVAPVAEDPEVAAAGPPADAADASPAQPSIDAEEALADVPPEQPAAVVSDQPIAAAPEQPAPIAPGVPVAEPQDPPAAAQPPLETGDEVAVAPDTPPAALPGDTVGIRLPVPEIENLAPGVTTDRLPSIGAQPVVANLTEPALIAHAAPFEGAPGVPVMSVVLRDAGADRPDIASLAEFPVALTVAIDPTAADAAEAMAAYRAAGVELVVLTPLPDGAAPADVEVAFQSFLQTVPETVAVLDVPEALLQENRPRAVQVAGILAESGHGLITYDRGLNAGLQVAANAGVKAASVFRTFDDGASDRSAMKRLLDQGAFRAGQENGVVMVGELRDETLSALTEWSLTNRASTVALAPVSTLLSRR